MVFSQSSLYVGSEEACLAFYAEASDQSRWLDGVMFVSCLHLIEFDGFVDTPHWTSNPHPEYFAKDDEKRLARELRQNGLTAGVLLVHLEFDDETQFFSDDAVNHGLRYVKVDGLGGARGKRYRALSDGDVLKVEDDQVLVSRLPFRLRIWEAVDTTAGFPKPSAA